MQVYTGWLQELRRRLQRLNCSALDLDEKDHSASSSTSANFSGVIAYMYRTTTTTAAKKGSCVARCHSLRMEHADSRRKPGVYAMLLHTHDAP